MTFYSETNWEQSSGPITSRKVHLTDQLATQILWPEGAPHDTLTNGEHPLVALGPKANRPRNVTGVVMTYDGVNAIVNVADKFISRQYVANILSFSSTTAVNLHKNAIHPFDPVYVDDSALIAAIHTGCTLSFSPHNGAGAANPLAGYVFWCQDQYDDAHVGGPNTDQAIPQPAAVDVNEILTLCIMQVNDYGYQSERGQ